jgi:hypothetical protein
MGSSNQRDDQCSSGIDWRASVVAHPALCNTMTDGRRRILTLTAAILKVPGNVESMRIHTICDDSIFP